LSQQVIAKRINSCHSVLTETQLLVLSALHEGHFSSVEKLQKGLILYS